MNRSYLLSIFNEVLAQIKARWNSTLIKTHALVFLQYNKSKNAIRRIILIKNVIA